MSIEDDDNQKKYLDFIDFCLINIDFQTNHFGYRNANIKNKSSLIEQYTLKNKFSIDFDILADYKFQLNALYSEIQENLLLFKIDEINKYTSYIPLEEVFRNLSFLDRIKYEQIDIKKNLLVDVNALKTLHKNRELNWISYFNSLYPIKTIGDGNCLCHAVLCYLVGMQDINLGLRETLKLFMNSSENGDKLKARWILHRQRNDANHKIETNEKQLETEWIEVKNMISNKQAILYKEASNKQDSVSSNQEVSEQSSSYLVYLEDIHIFALANLLRRTIIVISLETINNLQPIYLRGIYMPLLINSEECVKDPIVILYHNSHFMPLLLAHDDKSLYELEFECNEKWHDFENVNTRLNEPKQKNSQVFNLLPLIYNNLEPMIVHFLDKDEENKAGDLLSEYLNTIEMQHGTDQNIDILCCYLNKRSAYFSSNGIASYLKYLNETMSHFVNYNNNVLVKSEPILNLKQKLCKSLNCVNYTQPMKEYCSDCLEQKYLNRAFESNQNFNSDQQPSNTINSNNSIDYLKSSENNHRASNRLMNDDKIETSTSSSKIFSTPITSPRSEFLKENVNRMNDYAITRKPQLGTRYCSDCKIKSIVSDSLLCEICESIKRRYDENKNDYNSEVMKENKIKSNTKYIEIPITIDTKYANENTRKSDKNSTGDYSNRVLSNTDRLNQINSHSKSIGTWESEKLNNHRFKTAYNYQSPHSSTNQLRITCVRCQRLKYSSGDFCSECVNHTRLSAYNDQTPGYSRPKEQRAIKCVRCETLDYTSGDYCSECVNHTRLSTRK